MLTQLYGQIHFPFVAEPPLVIASHGVAASECGKHSPWNIAVVHLRMILGCEHAPFPQMMKIAQFQFCVAECLFVAEESGAELLFE